MTVFDRVLQQYGAAPSLQISEAEWDERDAVVACRRAAEETAARAQARRERASQLREEGFTRRAITRVLDVEVATNAAQQGTAAFVAAGQSLLILSGFTGTGKTTAATWAAMELSSVVASACGYLRASELEARGRFEGVALRKWLREKQLLVVDDLGTEHEDVRFASLLNEVVDLIYGERGVLIIATNLDLKDFGYRYGTRIESRLHEDGAWCGCGTLDLRKESP